MNDFIKSPYLEIFLLKIDYEISFEKKLFNDKYKKNWFKKERKLMKNKII